MLRFDPGVRIAFLSHDLSAVLRHASAWSLLTGIDVIVAAVSMPTARPEESAAAPAFVLELTAPDRISAIVELAGYLERVLPRDHDVAVVAERCRIERVPRAHRPDGDPLIARVQPHEATASDRPRRVVDGNTDGGASGGRSVP